jgi:hypothetical protein
VADLPGGTISSDEYGNIVVAIVQAARRRRAGKPVWKSSLLPFLLYGVLDRSSARLKKPESAEIKHLRAEASSIIMRFEEGEGGFGFRILEDRRSEAKRKA